MRTLSARIVLGFAVLIVTFAVITGTLVRNAVAVEDEVHLIRSGYLSLALHSNAIVVRDDNLVTYLTQGLNDETITKVSRARLKRSYTERRNALALARKDLDGGTDLLELNPQVYAYISGKVNELTAAAAANDPLYIAMLVKPPIGAASTTDETLMQTIATERRFQKAASELSDYMQNAVVRQTKLLESNEHISRQYTIYLGLGAVLAGLLVAIWAVLMLRPLGRLRVSARQVAAGDYKSKIPERGPAEVADLAREFNSMGRAIEERERELVRSERLAAVGKMAAMITHEVRNPLSSIGLNTELLEDELAPDAAEARALCRAITHEVDRLTAITEEYLAFARLPKPKIAAEPINTLVDALASFVREDLAARKVELFVEHGTGDPIALVDPAQLRQCLINLVRNAADAVVANGGGHIWLRTRRAETRVAIEVADNGTGIAEELLPKLFDQFFSTKDGGNGLGLALTHQIVKDHGGELAVESKVGRGTTFTVTVPGAAL
jgi:signal transduction histidine kinase